MLIKVAAGETLAADSLLMRSLCDSARGLPAASEEWDVSGLLQDGQPFSRDTVSSWLSCVHSAVDSITDLGPQDIQQLSTVTGLTQVLAFADAVGSRQSIFTAACSQLQQLKLVVHLPEQVLELPVIGRAYFWRSNQLQRQDLEVNGDAGPLLESDEQCRDVKQQVAQQLSTLLRLGHMLCPQPLLYVLHSFLSIDAQPSGGRQRLLAGVMGLVFTDAVWEAALGSSSISKEAYISSVLSQPCSSTPGRTGHNSLLKPVGPRVYDHTDTLRFDAELLRDFGGAEPVTQSRSSLTYLAASTAMQAGSFLTTTGQTPLCGCQHSFCWVTHILVMQLCSASYRAVSEARGR